MLLLLRCYRPPLSWPTLDWRYSFAVPSPWREILSWRESCGRSFQRTDQWLGSIQNRWSCCSKYSYQWWSFTPYWTIPTTWIDRPASTCSHEFPCWSSSQTGRDSTDACSTCCPCCPQGRSTWYLDRSRSRRVFISIVRTSVARCDQN